MIIFFLWFGFQMCYAYTPSDEMYYPVAIELCMDESGSLVKIRKYEAGVLVDIKPKRK